MVHLQVPLLDALDIGYQASGDSRTSDSKGEEKEKEQLFLSLQERFPVPQCLSETLTAEVSKAFSFSFVF